jgi:Tol biopolymer transport system component
MTRIMIAVIGLASLPAAGADELPAPEREIFQQDLCWSPDGKQIAYSQYAGDKDYADDKWSIQIVNFDGTGQRLVVANGMYVTFSKAGDRLAFGSQRDGNWEIYTAKPDGTDLQRLTNNPAKDQQPAWSPDGRLIAFSSDRAGREAVYVMNADGSSVGRVTVAMEKHFNPSWSPDGKWLVFYREKGDGMDQIERISLEGIGMELTRDTNHNVFPSYLPDGSIGFCSTPKGGKGRLVQLVLESKQRREIGPAGIFFARWSPDGKRIAFIAGEWPRSAIYTMNVDGGEIRKIAN